MNGEDKCFINLAGKPLIQHVIDSLAHQASQIYLSANADNAERLETFNLPVIVDQMSDRGPLSGLCSAMRHCETDAIAIVPCDSPFIPEDLIDRLYHGLASKKHICYASYEGRSQYAHSVWSSELRPELEERLSRDELSLKSLVKNMSSSAVEFEQKQVPPIFFNINSAQDLERARRYLQIDNK